MSKDTKVKAIMPTNAKAIYKAFAFKKALRDSEKLESITVLIV